MSAREDIDNLLRFHGVSKTGRQSVQILMGDFAHELAAQQRAWAREFGTTPTQQALRSIINETADLIDPEVEK